VEYVAGRSVSNNGIQAAAYMPDHTNRHPEKLPPPSFYNVPRTEPYPEPVSNGKVYENQLNNNTVLLDDTLSSFSPNTSSKVNTIKS